MNPTPGTAIHTMRRVMHKINDAYAAEINARWNKKGPTLALTLPQYIVLAEIAVSESPPSQTDLVNRTGTDRSTMAQIIVGLKKKGLIGRVRNKDDARAYAIRLTTEGTKILATVRPIVERVEETFLGNLPERQRSAFLAALKTLAFLDTDAPAEKTRKAA